jgi:hypothetical protein
LKEKIMRGSGARRECGGAVFASPLLKGSVPRLVETKEQAGVSRHRPVRVTRHSDDVLRFRDLPGIEQFITKGFKSPDQLIAVIKEAGEAIPTAPWQTPDNPPMGRD